MWNQLGSEGADLDFYIRSPRLNSRPAVILLIRTYAFFNRNASVLSFLIACLCGLIAYQLYVTTSQMECAYHNIVMSRPPLISNLVLPFVKPPGMKIPF